MQQVWMTRHGAPSVLTLQEADDPVPGPGEVRVRVHAAGINFADVLIRIGLYPDAPNLPAVIGYEVAGVVDAVGDDVVDITEGIRVLALLPSFGGYSDTVIIPANAAVRIPDELTFDKAAAIPVNYLTAWLLLIKLANVEPGEVVLIHSAAGGVGQAAVQLCRWKGARVVGTASPAKHSRLLELGVEHCIDSRTADFEHEVLRLTDGRGVDVALDAVGGKSFSRSYRCLAPLGRLCVFGVSGMVRGEDRKLTHVLREWLSTPRFSSLNLLQNSRSVLGMTLGCLKDNPRRRRELLDQIIDLVSQGILDPVVDRSYSFAEAAQAHEYLQSRNSFGKVVFTS
ncbi:MAG: zinc-binding dehydrogenase [Planctomycetaceae bacterium]|jgi:NADPH:quinone reductase-like Zn-dependent oxidoreductase